MNRTYIVTFIDTNIPLFNEMGLVQTISAQEFEDAEYWHQSLGVVGTELTACELNIVLSEKDILDQLEKMHPLMLWELFAMDRSCDEEIGGWEGWYEQGNHVFYAHAEDKYMVHLSVR